MGKIKRDALIGVTWIDIVSVNIWAGPEEAERAEPMLCKSVGYFLNADKAVPRMSWSVNRDGERDVMVIPVGCVLKITKLRGTNDRRV